MSTVTKEFRGDGGHTLGKDRRVRPRISLPRGICRPSLRNLNTHRVRRVDVAIGAVLLCAKSFAHLAGHLDFSAKLLTLSKGNIQSHMIFGVDPIWEFSWRTPQVSSAFGYFRSC